MSEKSNIKHKGVIEKISEDSIFVKIEPEHVCTMCRAQTFCGADTGEKMVEINKWDDDYNIGESVTILMQQSLGYKALFYGYIAPFLVLFIGLVIMLSAGVHEGVAGITSLLILAPYYGILYYYRDNLKKQFIFSIKKIYN